MIKKLRRKFIALSMGSVTVVIILLITLINIVNYYQVYKEINLKMNILIENNGKFPSSKELTINDDSELSPELPFKTRYFTVTVDKKDNSIQEVYLENVAFNENQIARSYVDKIKNKQIDNGFIDIYKYTRTYKDDSYLYIFIDSRDELHAFERFLSTSIIISLTSLLLIFLLIHFSSFIVIKPFIRNSEKQKQFITDASHELKTPLTIIGANLEVLELENGQNEWTQSSKNQLERLNNMTKKLLYLSRMDEGELKLSMNEFSLSLAINEIAYSFSTLITSEHKRLILEVDENISFCGDENSMKELISILLDNAIKYSTENGTINVSLKKSGKSLELIFTNDAENIKRGNYDRLFERFYRLDSSRNSQSGGSGIGLSIAKVIVEAHHGKITAYCEEDKKLIIKIIF